MLYGLYTILIVNQLKMKILFKNHKEEKMYLQYYTVSILKKKKQLAYKWALTVQTHVVPGSTI